MLKPICVGCKRFYRMVKSGYYFIEGKPRENGALPGTLAPDKWSPYKLWAGDLWECKSCGHVLVSGVGIAPISEDYKSDFKQRVEDLRAELQVNDC